MLLVAFVGKCLNLFEHTNGTQYSDTMTQGTQIIHPSVTSLEHVSKWLWFSIEYNVLFCPKRFKDQKPPSRHHRCEFQNQVYSVFRISFDLSVEEKTTKQTPTRNRWKSKSLSLGKNLVILNLPSLGDPTIVIFGTQGPHRFRKQIWEGLNFLWDPGNGFPLFCAVCFFLFAEVLQV